MQSDCPIDTFWYFLKVSLWQRKMKINARFTNFSHIRERKSSHYQSPKIHVIASTDICSLLIRFRKHVKKT